ncbi:MAG: peptidase C25, partial [Bacteroidia bacterium]|nr:peptidase C25 [Bacteroidia bacterium]
MKNCYFVLLFFFTIVTYSQSKDITINWQDFEIFENDNNAFKIPAFDSNHLSYTESEGLLYFTQWDTSSNLDPNSVILSNIRYSEISRDQLLDIEISTIPNAPKYELYNTSARGKTNAYFEITPIIKEQGRYKR